MTEGVIVCAVRVVRLLVREVVAVDVAYATVLVIVVVEVEVVSSALAMCVRRIACATRALRKKQCMAAPFWNVDYPQPWNSDRWQTQE